MKKKEQEKACQLRSQQGLSIREIARKLSVAKSSVSLWVRDITLSQSQIERLNEKLVNNRKNFYKHSLNHAQHLKERAAERHLRYRKQGKKKAKKDVFFRVICALYWADGTKDKNSFSITNCDEDMLRLVGGWLVKEGYGEKITFYLACHDTTKASNEEMQSFWKSKLPFLRDDMFRKFSRYKVNRASQLKRVGKQPNGTARLTVNNTELIQKVYGGIEYLREKSLNVGG